MRQCDFLSFTALVDAEDINRTAGWLFWLPIQGVFPTESPGNLFPKNKTYRRHKTKVEYSHIRK